MRFKTVGNKVDKAFIVVRNPSSTATIPNGAPCYFTMTATGVLGVDVQGAGAAGAGVASNFFAGIIASEQQAGAGNLGLGPGLYGEAQVWGFVQSLRLVAQTRASSSASFSTASGAIGDILGPATNTVAVSQITGTVTTATSALTLSYDAYSDIGPGSTAVTGGSYASASATNVSNTVAVPINIGQFAILAQTFTVSASASGALNSAVGAASLSAGSSILYSTIAVNAFLQYL